MLVDVGGLRLGGGKRASVENSSTSLRTVSTDEPIVSAQCRITFREAASGGVPRSR